jgi:Rrf2 family protein
MHLTRQADYAVRAILYLANAGNNRRSSTSDIAEHQVIPLSFLAKIIAQLSIAGILQTKRGAHGGVLLAREPASITLLEVVEAIDGPIRLNVCVVADYECNVQMCPVRSVWNDAQTDLVERLRSTTFDQFVQDGRMAGIRTE